MSEASEQAQLYQELVVTYEQVGAEIHELIRANGGHTKDMSQAVMERYRALATQRDDLYNQIKAIEATWGD